jgi:hypothetical protein
MKCIHCKELIPYNHVQQGMCHMECYHDYLNEEIPLYKVTLDKQSYVSEDFPDLSEDETCTEIKMKRIDFMNLKEFDGF